MRGRAERVRPAAPRPTPALARSIWDRLHVIHYCLAGLALISLAAFALLSWRLVDHARALSDRLQAAFATSGHPLVLAALDLVSLGETAKIGLVALTLLVVPIVVASLATGSRIRNILRQLEQSPSVAQLAEGSTAAILSSIADGVLVIDDSAHIESANTAAEMILGYQQGELIGQHIESVLRQAPANNGAAPGTGLVHLDQHATGVIAEMVGRRHDGTLFPLEVTLTDSAAQNSRQVTAVIRDLTRRKMAEAAIRHEDALRRSNEWFQALISSSLDIITVTGSDRLARYVSPAWETILGHNADDCVGRDPFQQVVHPEDFGQVTRFLDDAQSAPGLAIDVEFRARHHNGSWRYFQATASNLLSSASVQGIVVTWRDLTERKDFEDQLRYQAFLDPLTSLPNRSLFLDRLQRGLAAARRRGDALAVLFLDLDDFKLVNDSLGHVVGDRLLVTVAERLRATVREADTVARFGGDEFVVLLEEVTSQAEIEQIANRIEERMRHPFFLEGQEMVISASIGIAISTPVDSETEDLLRNADVALYEAKSAGKRRVQIYEPWMHAAIVDRIELEGDLRRALERNEFLPYYQPIVDLETLQVCGFEALVRWRHPVHGMIPPVRFIDRAEATGLIQPIGRLVLDHACREVGQWITGPRAIPSFRMNVNLSVRQMQEPGLVEYLASLIAEHAIPSGVLVLEITESALMQGTESAIRQLQAIKDLGILIAVDDFGTGYSSLSYLQQFPIDILKIDKSFVDGLADSEGGSPLADAVIKLGQSLQLDTIAEGVESFDQMLALRELGCHYAQGYFFARPMPTADLAALIDSVTPAFTS